LGVDFTTVFEGVSVTAVFTATAELFGEILKFKSTYFGGKQLVSSQVINSTSPTILMSLLGITFTFCLKVALFSKNLIFILKTLSKIVCPFSSEGFPISSKSSDLVNVNAVGIGPSSGTFCEYKCQFSSMVAFITKLYSVFEIFSVEVVHFTGLKI
jgi:hypothetical protein